MPLFDFRLQLAGFGSELLIVFVRKLPKGKKASASVVWSRYHVHVYLRAKKIQGANRNV